MSSVDDMSPGDSDDYGTRASTLVRRLIDEHDPMFGVGSMSCSIYDTAWVSMVSKIIDGQPKWLFPGSFHYLLGHQQHDGGWMTSSIGADSILHTLAALLALCKHIAEPHQLIYIPLEELQHKKDRAVYFLEAKFSQFDITSATTQNIEILIPKMLQLLEAEEIVFNFPGREELLQRRERKTVKCNPTNLYSTGRSTLIHYLEGFVGELDFDRLLHHKVSGSMMASPASTAAYLMHSSQWDDEAEAYLSYVVNQGDELSTGGVPSRYPNTVNEISTTISVLLEHGFKPGDLSPPHLDSAANFIQDCLALESGVVGFAPHVECDANNTARSISALGLMGTSVTAQGMIDRYETKEFFKTFPQDRNPSFATNCLILKSFLEISSRLHADLAQIQKLVRFISNCWWTTNGPIEDGVNSSDNYPVMLMTQAFTHLVHLCDHGILSVFDDEVLKQKVFLCLFQALVRTLQTQNQDGSWGRGNRSETTAYAVLSLTRLSALSSIPQLKRQVAQAIEDARKFLVKAIRTRAEPDRIWQEKTNTGSFTVFQAYILAALRAPVESSKPGCTIESRFDLPVARIVIYTKYFGRQPWFKAISEWQTQAFLIESHLFLPQLRQVQYAVFPQETLTDDKHFGLIPFVWIAAGTVRRRSVGPEFLFQMMIMTFLTRQLEEYISKVLCEIFAGCMFEVEDTIHSIFNELETFDAKDHCFCGDYGSNLNRSSISTSGTVSLSEARSVLYRYISHIINHPYVLMASHHDQDELRTELLAYLLTRLANSTASTPVPGNQEDALARSIYSGAPEQTCHRLVFAFLCCVVGSQAPNGSIGLRRDFLESPEQHYLLADICRRLSIISVMSLANQDPSLVEAPYRESPVEPEVSTFSVSSRDSLQSELSSASATSSLYSDSGSWMSPVSSISSVPSPSPTRHTYSKQILNMYSQPLEPKSEEAERLARLLAYEHRCLDMCLESLVGAEMNNASLNIVNLFIDSSGLSAQIFNDPNIGASQSFAVSSDERENYSTRQVCIVDPIPPAPKRSPRRGSVSAARAALEIAPLKPRRNSSSQSASRESRSRSSECSREKNPSASEMRIYPSGDDIKLTGTSERQREWNLTRENKVMNYKKASRSSVEIHRIEIIMGEMEGIACAESSNLPPCPEPRSDAENTLPKPKINPIFSIHPALRPKKTCATLRTKEPHSAESASAQQPFSPPSFNIQTPEVHPEVPVVPSDVTLQQNRPPTPAKDQHYKSQASRKAEERHRTRVNSLETWAAGGATPLPKPAPRSDHGRSASDLAHSEKFRRAKTENITSRRAVYSAPVVLPKPVRASTADAAPRRGWVKAPPPTNNNGELAFEVERVERLKKLRRGSRLGGPRWRAPF